MIKAIIFDFGSVVFESDWDAINNDFLEKYGFDVKLEGRKEHREVIEIFKDSQVGKSNVGEFLKILGPKVDVEELIEFYQDSYLRNKILNSGIVKLIDKLKKNYVLYGFTDTTQAHLDANKDEGWFRNFERVFSSVEFGKLKSDETAFDDLAKHIKFKPEECLFIDDHPLNIENAEKKGFKVIYYEDFPDIKSLEEALKKLKVKF